jgi:hypothetical protein
LAKSILGEKLTPKSFPLTFCACMQTESYSCGQSFKESLRVKQEKQKNTEAGGRGRLSEPAKGILGNQGEA